MSPLVDAFLSRFTIPMRVWLAPGAQTRYDAELRAFSDLPMSLARDLADPNAHLDGPAVLVLVPDDLRGPHRERLLELKEVARPGRPVLVGGTADRDALLDAVNTWRVSRVLVDEAPTSSLVEALRHAHETTRFDVALELAAKELSAETTRLDEAVRELRGTRDRLLHAERLSTMGRIASGLQQSMTRHLAALETFRERAGVFADDPDLGPLVSVAEDGIQSINSLLREIQADSAQREMSYVFSQEPLDQVVRRAVAFSRYDKLAVRRALATDIGSDATVSVDRHRMHQVINNLLRNAFQATGPGDRVLVRTWKDEDHAYVEVRDTGRGIAPEHVDRIFDPFFTTKGAGGMGLGLRSCRTTVERHGGSMSVRSAQGEGTSFTISLPLAQAESDD